MEFQPVLGNFDKILAESFRVRSRSEYSPVIIICKRVWEIIAQSVKFKVF